MISSPHQISDLPLFPVLGTKIGPPTVSFASGLIFFSAVLAVPTLKLAGMRRDLRFDTKGFNLSGWGDVVGTRPFRAYTNTDL